MRLTWRDAVATVLTAGGVALYAAYIQGANLPMVSSPRAIAGAVLALGFVACNVGAPVAFHPGAKRWSTAIGSVLGVAILVAGTAALITGSTATLAALVGATVVLWAFTTVHHASSDDDHGPTADDLLDQHKDQLPPRLNVS